jgi:hypothetical protein
LARQLLAFGRRQVLEPRVLNVSVILTDLEKLLRSVIGENTRLATVYGIVKQSGGYVWVYSELGHGTDFKIYLPMVETLAESKARSQRSQEPLARGSETILLVEDDAALREVTCDFLRTSGYIVLTAGSPNKPFASRTLTIVRSTFS